MEISLFRSSAEVSGLLTVSIMRVTTAGSGGRSASFFSSVC